MFFNCFVLADHPYSFFVRLIVFFIFLLDFLVKLIYLEYYLKYIFLTEKKGNQLRFSYIVNLKFPLNTLLLINRHIIVLILI